jgi:hypothetical protein
VIAPRDTFEPITNDHWTQLRAAWPDGERLRLAWQLARDVDTLGDLLAGRTVDPSRLDQDELVRARRRKLVMLVSALELLEGVA